MDKLNDDLTPEEFLDITVMAGNLKTEYRHCYTDRDRRESVAEHSWRIALMAMLLTHEESFKDTDVNKVIRMCLIHDLGEVFTGDIPAFKKTEQNHETEWTFIKEWIGELPSLLRAEWQDLFDEMKALTTKEAKLFKALDKIEAVIAHNESDIKTWQENEYGFQFTYAADSVRISRYLTEVRRLVDEWTERKIKGGDDDIV